MNALMKAAPWSQFLRRRSVDDVPDYLIGGAFLGVVVVGVLAAFERRMLAQWRLMMLEAERGEGPSPRLAAPPSASARVEEEEEALSGDDAVAREPPSPSAPLPAAGRSALSRQDDGLQLLLKGPGAVELTVLAFHLGCGGDQLNWPAVCGAVCSVGADVVALSECEGNLQRLADACGYPFVDRKRNLMAKYPLFDSASTTTAANSPAGSPLRGTGRIGGSWGGGLIGSGGFSPRANGLSDGFGIGFGADGLSGDGGFGDAHVWMMVAPGRFVAVALLPPCSPEDRFVDNAGEGGSVALRGLARLAAHGVPVFLCGETMAAAASGRGRPLDPRVDPRLPPAALAERASALGRLTPPASPCSSRNGDSSSASTSRHVLASAGFRDSFAEAHTSAAASNVAKDANDDDAGGDGGGADFAPVAAGAAVHCLLTAGPARTLRCNACDASASTQSISSSRSNTCKGGGIGGGGCDGLLAGCRAAASSFRALPAASPPVVAVEPSVAVEGDDFCVRPFDSSSDGWWVEVRTASHRNNRYSSRHSGASNSGGLPNSALLNTGLSGSSGFSGGGFSGAHAAGVAVLSWREETGGRLCARFAGGLGAGCYDAVLLDSRTGADLATARFQVLSKDEPPTLLVPSGPRLRRGTPIRLAVRNAPGWPHDWCGLFARGAPLGGRLGRALSGRAALHGRCFADLEVPTTAADHGEPLPAGEYEVRLMRDNSPTVVARVHVTLADDFATALGGSGSRSVGSRSVGSRSVSSGSSNGTRGGGGGGSLGGSPQRPPLASSSQRRAALGALGAFRPLVEDATAAGDSGLSGGRLSSIGGHLGSVDNIGGGIQHGVDKFHTPMASPAGTPAASPLRLRLPVKLRGEPRGL